MDAGVVAIVGASAGVLGALVGATGAIAAAAVNSRGQARSQHTQWRRQVRRDAYAAVSSAASELAFSLGSQQALMLRSQRPAQELVAQAKQQLVDLMHAVAAVQLEGPRSIAEAADATLAAFTAWHAVATVGLIQGAMPTGAQLPAALQGIEARARNSLRDFVAAAREALDDSDGAMGDRR